MKARDQIISLINQYSFTLDSGDLEGFARLFRHGQWRFDEEKPLMGSRAVRDKLLSRIILYPNGTPRTRHATTNVDITVDVHAGKARCRRYVQVFQQTDDLPLQLIISGDHLDTFFEDANGNWHFSSCRVMHPLTGDLSHHMHPPRRACSGTAKSVHMSA